MSFSIPIGSVCDTGIFVKIFSRAGRPAPHTEDIIPIRASLMAWNWKNRVPLLTVYEPRFHERTPHETFHLVESNASFSLRLGDGLGTGCGELGRLFFGAEPMSAFIDSAIRFVPASALNTARNWGNRVLLYIRFTCSSPTGITYEHFWCRLRTTFSAPGESAATGADGA